MSKAPPKSRFWSATFIVTGTAIGAGMLGLPLASGEGGFVPAILFHTLCWLFMASTALLLLEVCSWMPEDSNLVSMARHILGPFGSAAAWVLYIFLFYSLTVAYIAGGGDFLAEALNFSPWVGILLFTLLFAPIVAVGARAVGRANNLLMFGLAGAYFLFVFLGSKKIDPELLSHSNWRAAATALPIIFVSFSFQGTIPSLYAYLGQDVKTTRRAILLGSMLPLFIYLVWELLIMGVVPVEGLLAAARQGDNAVKPLESVIQAPLLISVGKAFAFFALSTSFLGVTLGLIDFLKDSLRVRGKGSTKFKLWCAVFLPAMAIAIKSPNIFLIALKYAGGFGCALLLGLLPILMVWVGRYSMKLKKVRGGLVGGRFALSLLLIFLAFQLVVMITSI